MQFEFSKWQGTGNDFVIVDGTKHMIDHYAETAVKVCDRHFGIGADGLVLILPSKIADFEMRIFNSDGSEAEMCGNVTRCVARYVYERGLTAKTEIVLETKAGLIRPALRIENDKILSVRVNMGKPVLNADQIPAEGHGDHRIVGVPLIIGGQAYDITCVSMGNPHCVIFTDCIEAVRLSEIGPMIETHPMFPKKTNVEFAQILNRREIRKRVWERGAGITMACGTGACATLVASVLNGKTERNAKLKLDGGELEIEWNEEDGCVYMSGPAVEVFNGCYIAEDSMC